MDPSKKALESLRADLESQKRRKILSFEEFLEITKTEPQKVFRNVFQLFHDMVKSRIGKGEDEYPDDPESVGFVKYDCSKIFIHGMDSPFFPDRLFANRFVRQVETLKKGSQQNRIHVYEGPHGCGKSTFMDNLLETFEEYTDTEEGESFEIFWDIDIEGEKVSFSCPSHDYPILIVPRNYRANFLDKLLSDGFTELKHKISSEKEYEWLFDNEVCTICRSLFWALFDKTGSIDKVLDMVKVRHYKFDRRLGEGISVFNPGDAPIKEVKLSDNLIQKKLDKIFGAKVVKYVFSPHARINNGVYVLMDIKSHNEERLIELHNIISEGVHKVNGSVEERISSLFFALMNPEDKEKIKEHNASSFQGRIQYNKIPYVLDVPTELAIQRSIFGEKIDSYFLPGVLDNFVRVIISSRMNPGCEVLKEWIPNMAKYSKYCDGDGLLLRMEIYGGTIPRWLSEEDRKRLNASTRRKLISEGEREGEMGFSGRDSVRLFGDFISYFGGRTNLINMGNVSDFFKHKIGKVQRNENIPKNFLNSLVGWYDYLILGEVKESLYFYNEETITENILHYIYATNYEIGHAKVKCEWTGKDVEITEEFFRKLGAYFVGKDINKDDALTHANSIQRRYIEIIAKDPGKKITETELFQELFASYARSLKERVLEPFLKNDNFRQAIKCFRTDDFKTFDTRLKEHIVHMIKNLVEKFGYTEQGAKEICLYVIDQKLVEKFSK